MPSTAPSILDRYLDKVIQDNKTIDARGVMQVNRIIELSMEDVFIHLTVRMNRSDKWSSLLDTINLYHTYSEPDPLFTRKPIPRVPEILWQSYSDYGETEQGVPTDARCSTAAISPARIFATASLTERNSPIAIYPACVSIRPN